MTLGRFQGGPALYHVAFFVDERDFLNRKLSHFLGSLTAPAFIRNKGREIELLSMDDIPRAYWPFWVIFGQRSGTVPFSDDFDVFWYNTEEELSHLLEMISKSFDYAVFPWGRPYYDYSMFAFVSENRELRDHFVQDSCNLLTLPLTRGLVRPEEDNMFVSCYGVSSRLQEVCQTVLIEEKWEQEGHLVWETCCAEQPPLIICLADYGEPIRDVLMERAEFRTLPRFERVGILGGPFGNRFYIYQPMDFPTFHAFCKLAYGSEELPVFAVSGGSEHGNISRMLFDLEFGKPYSDLCLIGRMQERFGWLYAVNRCNTDGGISLFTCSDRKLVRRLLAAQGDPEKTRIMSVF